MLKRISKIQKRKNKRGRPRVENLRSVGFGFKATPEEAAQLRELAAAHGLKPGTFARVKALGGSPPSKVQRAEILSLARLGHLQNQFLKYARAGNITGVDDAILRVLNDIKRGINKLVLRGRV